MATITQTVPAYTGGISQQPDELKIPGQVNTAKNVYPDVTFGLQKRPGGRVVASLSDSGTLTIPGGTNYDPDSNTNGRWFSYYRDEAEQYIGQVNRTGEIRMWKCSDGTPVPVIYDQGTGRETAQKLYLNHNADDDIQTLTLNDHTYITNRATLKNDGSAHPKTTAAMSATVEPVRPAEVFVDLKKISYSSQYSLNLFDSTDTDEISTATRIEVERDIDSKNNCESDNDMAASGNLPDGGHFCSNAAGEDQDAYCPNVATRIFKINAYGSGSEYEAGPSADANGTAHDYVVTRSGSQVTTGKNLFFRIATTGQSVAQGGSQSNPDYRCRYTTTHDLLYGGEGWYTGDYFYVWMKNARYKITVKDHSISKVQCRMDGNAGSGAIRPIPTPFDNETTITAESILGDIRTTIVDYDNGIVADEVEQIGTGLYITDGDAFNASTPVGTLMNVIQKTIQDPEDLPQQCKHGYVVEVKNSDSDDDNYFVKFFGENDKDGRGVWEECAEPGRKIEFDKDTMPIDLVRRQDDGSGTKTGTANAIYFSVENPPWENCLVGSWDASSEKGTVPEPSFIGNKINRMLLWRNRLVILSDSKIIMSRPGDFFSFWPKTALTFSNVDPIDIELGSNFPAIAYDAVQVNAGLIVFTKNQQFLITTDSDILNPTTIKINALCNYNFNHKTNPVSLGTTVAWLDNAGKYSRFFEVAKITRDLDPDVIEQSKIVGKLFDNDLNNISISRENGAIFFSEKNTKTLYGFKYFNAPEKRLQQAWFTWELCGNAQYHSVLDDSLYIVVRNGSKDVLQKYDIKIETDSRLITDDKDTTDTADDVDYRVHLDNSQVIAAAQLGYSSTTGRTGFTLPDAFKDFNTTAQIVVFCNKASSTSSSSQAAQDSDLIGAYSTASIISNQNIEWDGDWTGHDIIVGYLYDMEVVFPTIHVVRQEGEAFRADTRSSLVLHRAKLNLGASGLYQTILKRTGKTDYTETWEPTLANTYNANRVQFTENSIKTIPIYDRNTNTTLTLKSTHPSPATLHSMTWEGDYNTRFYSRV